MWGQEKQTIPPAHWGGRGYVLSRPGLFRWAGSSRIHCVIAVLFVLRVITLCPHVAAFKKSNPYTRGFNLGWGRRADHCAILVGDLVSCFVLHKTYTKR